MSRDFDDRKWREILRKVMGAADSYVKVGIVGTEAAIVHGDSDDDLTNAEIGYIQHYGTEDIPARPFISSTFERRGDELARLQARACEGLLAGRLKLEGGLSLIGAWAAGAVKRNITRDGSFKPLKPETIRRKGSSRPLVDTGQLVGSVTFVVVTAAAAPEAG